MTGLTEVTPGSVGLLGLQADANKEIIPRKIARFMGPGYLDVSLIEMIKKGDNLEGWVASKITKAKEEISVVADYMESEMTVNADTGTEQPQEPIQPEQPE